VKPLLSICCITYNQEKYIEKTINGFLNQQTNFPIEIIIHDDASIDSTQRIINNFQKKYPKIIKLIIQKKNQYSLGKKITPIILQKATGKYIAYCEGDDYWTDPLKLQKQVDFLEKNPDFTITSHNVFVYYQNENKYIEWLGKNHRSISTINNLLKFGSSGATCSLVFKNNKQILREFYKISQNISGADWLLQIIFTKYGKMKYFKDIMGVYRRHDNGISKPNSKNDEIKIFDDGGVQTCETLNNYFNDQFNKEINYNLANYFYLNLFKIYKKYNDDLGTKFYIKKILSKFKYLNSDTFKYVPYFLVKLYLIDIYYFLKKHIKDIKTVYLSFTKKNHERKDYERLKKIAKDTKVKKIHLGSGPRVLKNWINLDIRYEHYQKYLKYYTNKFYPAQIRGTRKDFYLFDVTKHKIPLPSSSVEVVFHEDFIEHLNQKEQILLLAEVYRVLKPGSVHRISTPSLFPALKNRQTKFKDGYDGIGTGIWDDYVHKNILTPQYLKEIALKVGYKQVRFSGRDRSLAKNLPLEYRPDPKNSRDEDHIFCDLIK